MAGIWNINDLSGANLKKVSKKLTFQPGDSFSARIVGKGNDSKEIIIKTVDGWQFPALLEKSLTNLPEGMVRFQVVGYEEGKLKLKLIAAEEKDSNKEEPLVGILLENGLEKEDVSILKDMIKHSMPLTRENISKIKSLLDFIEKINEDSGDEYQAFVTKYLDIKNISSDSVKGKEIASILNKFIIEVKDITPEDLFTLIENDIELTTENLQSYKNIVKASCGIDKSLVRLKDYINSQEFSLFKTEKQNMIIGEMDNKIFTNLIPMDEKKTLRSLQKAVFEYVGIDLPNDVDVQFIKEKINDILKCLNNSVNNKSMNKSFVEKQSKEIINEIKKLVGSSVILENKDYAAILDRVYDNVFPIDEKNILRSLQKAVFEYVGKQIPDSIDVKLIKEKVNDISNSINNDSNNQLVDKVFIEKQSKEIINEIKKIIGNQVRIENRDYAVILNRTYDNMFENNEGYYSFKNIIKVSENNRDLNLNVDAVVLQKNLVQEKKEQLPLNIYSQNYIKNTEDKDKNNILSIIHEFINDDNMNPLVKGNVMEKGIQAKDDMDIKSKLLKLIEKDYITNEQYEKVKENINNCDLQMFEGKVNGGIKDANGQQIKIEKFIDKIESILKDIIGIDIKFDEKIMKDIIRLVADKFRQHGDTIDRQVIGQIQRKTEETKTIIESLMKTRSEIGEDGFNYIMNKVKSEINDLKVFNNLSERYYYADIPLQLNDKDYPCKIIIKDDRKKGKKIDSKNVKMVLSVTTLNIGIVDVYLRVKDKSMNIEVQCEGNWISNLDKVKNKLEEDLNNYGYLVKIQVSEKKKALNIANCRDFFSESNSVNLNVIV